jgi:hypothetical protein
MREMVVFMYPTGRAALHYVTRGHFVMHGLKNIHIQVSFIDKPVSRRCRRELPVTLIGVHGEEYHHRAGQDPFYLPGCIESVPIGHIDIHQHQVGGQTACLKNGFVAGACLADDLDCAEFFQMQPYRAPEFRVIVGQ